MTKTQQFVIWLDGFLEASSNNDLKSADVKKIKTKLDNIFEHVAEKPAHKKTLEDLSKEHNFPVHSGLPHNSWPPSNGDIYRC